MISNVIANNCAGARYFLLNKSLFLNPFIWNLIKLSDFIKIVQNYDEINFNNITVCFTNNEIHKDHDNDKCSTIILNDINAKIYFIHHHYSEKINSCIKVLRANGNDYEIVGQDILKYIHNKWIHRLQRMINTPIFVYYDSPSLTNCNIEELLTLDTKYQIIVISDNDYSKYESKNIHYIHRITGRTDIIAKQINDFLK